MYRELRKMRIKGGKDKALANYVAGLQNRNKIKTYVTTEGYLAYDTEELAEYQAKTHKGRPSKREAVVVTEVEDD